MYEYKFEHLTLSPERTKNLDYLLADMYDFRGIIEENAAHGWRYVDMVKLSPNATVCLMVFEREKRNAPVFFLLEKEPCHA